jgi:hypothetical protein
MIFASHPLQSLIKRQILLGNVAWLENQKRKILEQACLERGLPINGDRRRLAHVLVSQVRRSNISRILLTVP